MHSPSENSSTAWSLPLLLRSGIAARCQPVTRGVPFPRGLLTDPNALGLSDDAGREIALQTQTLARWPDGSVRWLLLDFLIDQMSAGEHRWTLRCRGAAPGGTLPALSVRETPDPFYGILVSSGVAEYRLGNFSFSLGARGGDSEEPPWEVGLGYVWLPPMVADLITSLAIEETGPVRATVCLLGDFVQGPRSCSYTSRLSFFGGTGLVRLCLTVQNARRASHKGGLWDLGSRGAAKFRYLALRGYMHHAGEVRWTAETGQPICAASEERFEIYQDSSGGANWQSRNHVNRGGRVPCSFRGYRVRQGGAETSGLRASPVVTIVSERVALTVAVPEFWQQFPKAIQVEEGVELLFPIDGGKAKEAIHGKVREFTLGLLPGQFGDGFELQGGEQKTQTVWLHFGPPPEGDELPLTWVHNPVSVTLLPAWYAACGVLPCPPSGKEANRLDTLLNEAVDGPNSFFARREIIDEYGWRNYGEVYADHENAHYSGPKPIISHYNNQYDVVHGMLLQYFRTGDQRWWELADPLARHVIDIDIYHTKRDKAAYSGGLFWHTDHYRDAATCTHRAYSKANAVPGRPYGGGPSCEHNYTTGLLYYHYLTGDPLARAAVLELAEWVLRMDDGTRNILGLVDDGPTGLASATREPNYHGPGRGAGNSVNALLDAWLLTGRRHYLEYAERLIRRCVHPADNVAARNLLDIENRWSYTVFLSVLCRYLDLKAEAGELDFLYAYARASLLHYAEWMEQHERPYFEQSNKLEFPTETWAAQELRKANVLRLAARYADEPLRERLLRRGEEFAERAWSDLLRFESRTTARPLAIMMREGPVDLGLRSDPNPSPQPPPRGGEGEKDRSGSPSPPRGGGWGEGFGQPETFVPQRQRVKAQMKSPGGLLRLGLRLLSPRRWKRYLTRYRR